MIPYGDYVDANTEMNTWRVEHTIKDKKLTLKIYNETTKSWDVVGALSLSTNYEFNITNLFGRYASGTDVCMNGVVDYVEITTKEKPHVQLEIKDVNYRWDFDNLNEKNGLNNLTDTDQSTKSYTLQDGTLVLTDRTTDFTLAKPFQLSDKYDWSIEWRVQMEKSSSLFGNDISKQNFLYLAFEVGTWSFPFRLVDGGGTASMIPYGSYVNANKEMNTWRAEYSAETQVMTLKLFDSAANAWTVVGEKEMSSFTATFTRMFGRYTTDVTVCLNGVVDYIEVNTKEVTEK